MGKIVSPGSEFEVMPAARELWPEAINRADQLAMQTAGKFAAVGHSAQEAASLAAHALLTSAWHAAAAGRAFVGGKPDSEAFAAIALQVAVVGGHDV